jgi:hypothetical protein
VRQIDFNELPRATRERFIQSLMSDVPASAPLCRRTVRPRSKAGWYVLVVVALIAIGGLAVPRFGRLDAPVEDRRFLGGYVIASAVLGLGLSGIARRRALGGALPFTPGVYVFPLDLVDARTREIGLYSLTEMMSIEPAHHQKNGVYTHSNVWFVFSTESFTFEIKGREQADALVAKVQGARQIAASAIQRGALHELAALDPFAEARARNFDPAHDYGLLARDAPIWTRFVWAITIVSGLLIGVAAWRGRNWVSDARAFSRLQQKPDAVTAKAYLDGGGLHGAEVKNTILPRAQLIRAKAETGLKRAEALERFLKEYPRSTVDAEARGALAEVLHTHYLAQTTVAGLRAFVLRWPAAADVTAARSKIHELYQETLADFRQHANVTDKSVVPVVEAMLAWAEERGTPLDVRFRRRMATTLAPTDKLLTKNLLDDDGPSKNGNAEVSPLFASAASTAAREATLVRGLERGFKRVFPADVVPLRAAAPLEDAPGKPALPLPEVPLPTIAVDYEIGWSGVTYVARDRGRRFLGLFVKFDVAVQVPKEPRVLSFSLKVEPPESFPVDARADASAPRAPNEPSEPLPRSPHDDDHVYDTMILRAFEHMSAALVNVFFEPRAAATRAPE